jgi:hypothetical protein
MLPYLFGYVFLWGFLSGAIVSEIREKYPIGRVFFISILGGFFWPIFILWSIFS